MKYLVVQMVNSGLDEIEEHESGVITCDIGDGLPWAFAKSPLFDTVQEADKFAKKLFREQVCKTIGECGKLYEGWYFNPANSSMTLEIFKEHEDEIVDAEWIFTIDVVQIESE